jgi:hypothetical protein
MCELPRTWALGRVELVGAWFLRPREPRSQPASMSRARVVVQWLNPESPRPLHSKLTGETRGFRQGQLIGSYEALVTWVRSEEP